MLFLYGLSIYFCQLDGTDGVLTTLTIPSNCVLVVPDALVFDTLLLFSPFVKCVRHVAGWSSVNGGTKYSIF